jgi:hypothetical protein
MPVQTFFLNIIKYNAHSHSSYEGINRNTKHTRPQKNSFQYNYIILVESEMMRSVGPHM